MGFPAQKKRPRCAHVHPHTVAIDRAVGRRLLQRSVRTRPGVFYCSTAHSRSRRPSPWRWGEGGGGGERSQEQTEIKVCEKLPPRAAHINMTHQLVDRRRCCPKKRVSFPLAAPPQHHNADLTGSSVDLHPHRGLTAAPAPWQQPFGLVVVAANQLP